MRIIFLIAQVALFFWGCHSSKQVVGPSEPMERRMLDTVTVRAEPLSPDEQETNWELPVYNASASRTIDLVHTKLDVRFDWENEVVFGRAELTMKPWFFPVQVVELDAVNFTIDNIRLLNTGIQLQFENTGEKLLINLNRPYSREEEIRLFIQYSARPGEAGTLQGGAIASDQGLFFINPRGTEDKPTQIWTQGETESNSRWFPTIDKPNERCTQEISITVEDRFKTLSNGLLVGSKANPDGTRTDTWAMDQPHAPYLFMMAIGEFAIVEDSWEGIPLYYYVEPEYEADARAIFAHTPEMLTFFSELLGYRYPWPKYAQVVVRDYVSGAMENTTATIFGDFVQKKRQALIDNNNDGIVAHELFHHWFGDLVTCESWANLTLNEGFASYSEYLWNQYKYGRDQADYDRQNDLQGYFVSAARNAHDLIYYDYPDKEATFDAHSYNKGGLVLHMLRKMTGDEAFFASLNKYLTDHAYSDVEADELRMAFEEVTGQDLNWFFNQWFFDKGHPQLDITHRYDADAGRYYITVEQTQDPRAYPPIFQLPFTIDIYYQDGSVVREQVFMDQRKQDFSFEVETAPAFVNVDAEDALLAEINETLPMNFYLFQYERAPLFRDRMEALMALKEVEDSVATLVRLKGLNDPFWRIRQYSIQFADLADPDHRFLLEQMAKADPNSKVRSAALNSLAESGDLRYIQLAEEVIRRDSAFRCLSAALEILRTMDAKVALAYAERLGKSAPPELLGAIANIYAASPDSSHAPFFEQNWEKVQGFSAFDFFTHYTRIIRVMSSADQMNSLDKLYRIGLEDTSPFRRFAATNSLNQLRNTLKEELAENESDDAKSALLDHLNQLIEAIIGAETNEQILRYYSNF